MHFHTLSVLFIHHYLYISTLGLKNFGESATDARMSGIAKYSVPADEPAPVSAVCTFSSRCTYNIFLSRGISGSDFSGLVEKQLLWSCSAWSGRLTSKIPPYLLLCTRPGRAIQKSFSHTICSKPDWWQWAVVYQKKLPAWHKSFPTYKWP